MFRRCVLVTRVFESAAKSGEKKLRKRWSPELRACSGQHLVAPRDPVP